MAQFIDTSSTFLACPRCSGTFDGNAEFLRHYADCDGTLPAAPAPAPAAPARCSEHPAFDADYCPSCGTARVIGGAL